MAEGSGGESLREILVIWSDSGDRRQSGKSSMLLQSVESHLAEDGMLCNYFSSRIVLFNQKILGN